LKITVSDLSFSYKKRSIFKNAHFSAESGKICALIGPNGTGKSTMIKCIDGILNVSGGEIFADDDNLIHKSQKERARYFGYVQQTTMVRPGLNVMETVLSGRIPQIRRKISDGDLNIAENVLVTLGLEEFAFRQVHELSGGERQRVLMARAIAKNTPVMLLDEPTSNLDIRYQLETMETLHMLSRKREITVIAVIHDMNTVLRYADHVVLMHNGGIYAEGSPDEVITVENIAEAFGVEVDFIKHDGYRIMAQKKNVNNNIKETMI
jgi:iron complex transport system ATP-binding protein